MARNEVTNLKITVKVLLQKQQQSPFITKQSPKKRAKTSLVPKTVLKREQEQQSFN